MLLRSANMLGILANVADPRASTAAAFAHAVAGTDGPIVVLSHFDADGLAAAAGRPHPLRAMAAVRAMAAMRTMPAVRTMPMGARAVTR